MAFFDGATSAMGSNAGMPGSAVLASAAAFARSRAGCATSSGLEGTRVAGIATESVVSSDGPGRAPPPALVHPLRQPPTNRGIADDP